MYRTIHLETGDRKPSASAVRAIAIALYEKTAVLPAGYAELDRQCGGALAAALKRSEFSAGKGVVTVVYGQEMADGTNEKKSRRASASSPSALRPPPSALSFPSRIFIVGLGDATKFNAEAMRVGAAKLLRTAFAAKVTHLTLNLRPGIGMGLNDETTGRAAGDGFAIANFEFDTFRGAAGGKENADAKTRTPASKTAARNPMPSFESSAPNATLDLTLSPDSALASHIERSLIIGESANLTRSLAATPPNVANPKTIAAFCKAMSRDAGLKCTVIDAAHAASLNMGGLVAVGSAGSEPPAMIVMEWKGNEERGTRNEERKGGEKTRGLHSSVAPRPSFLAPQSSPILLVGKAITFDSGGISIKPADNMDKMKYDKCGGMAVIGAMQAIARLKLPLDVVGIVPCAENLLGENSYRPADILTHFNGVTSEVLNTDAEGRLVLADALAYGTRTYKPQAVIDLATLTGACVVALGTACAGAFCGDGDFRGHLFDAAEFTGERLWHMPLWDEHRQQIKGTHGDIVNTGGREAGACTAAAFLSFFIEPDGPKQLPLLPWCHLDIAGVADVKADTPLYSKGPTGFGVRLLVRALETWQHRTPRHAPPPHPVEDSSLSQPRDSGPKAVGVPVERG